MQTVTDYFYWALKSLQMVTALMKLKDTWFMEENYDKARQHIKKQRHYLANKGSSSQSYGFSSSQVWMWELHHKESWASKNWHFWTVVLEKTLESPLNYKEIKSVNPKENQSWIFIGRTDVEAEAPILFPPDVKSWLFGKDSNAGEDRRQEEKGTRENEIRQHHWLNRHESEQTRGASEGQGSLTCCRPWGRRVRHHLVTEQQQQQQGLMLSSLASSFPLVEFYHL